MSGTAQFALFEQATGYALFRLKEFEDIGLAIREVQESMDDIQRFCSVVKLEAFEEFRDSEAALENCTCIAEGQLHPDLLHFLEANLPRHKKKSTTLAVSDAKLASSISEQLDYVKCQISGAVPEIMRGIRTHFERMTKDLSQHSLKKAQLSLGHNYSRRKVKFDIHRVDNMVIQSIALLDQLDKDINLFGMRIREWYSYHFPELYKLVPDQLNYVKCASTIMDRKKLSDEVTVKLKAFLEEEKVADIMETARTSMGMDISDLDLHNVKRFAKRVNALITYRQELHEYIKERMHSCAPSLSALVGEQVGARLISHAGSLTNLAKYPASTVQILGAEKALFRALKTRSNTPKYGLLFHSSFIGRASVKNKGRISRFLANKCTMASRIDCFSDLPLATFGEHLRQQVEDRLEYLETGTTPKKNLDVMKEAVEEALVLKTKILKKRKKEAKKLKESVSLTEESKDAEGMEIDHEAVKKKSRKRKMETYGKSASEQDALSYEDMLQSGQKKKKKRKKHESEVQNDSELHEPVEEELISPSVVDNKKEKKKKKHSVE